MANFEAARALLEEFKGDKYVFGSGVLDRAGDVTLQLGERAAFVHPVFAGHEPLTDRVRRSLMNAGIDIIAQIDGAKPNAPREDLARITSELSAIDPQVIVCLGAGSTIDATKSAEVLRTLGGKIDDYFGAGKVTAKLQETGKPLTPMVAVQTAASSAAHLTKYSNITDISAGQKKLVVDEAIVPVRAVFDYDVTTSMSPKFTADGALDGLSHALEVLYDSVRKPYYDRMQVVAREAVSLIAEYLKQAVDNPDDLAARTALGLATDLGGYSIMLGGTSGPHVTSFSLVDILSHGAACGMLLPYYTVLFAPAVQEPLRMVGGILKDAGFSNADMDRLSGRDLGMAVAEALMELSRSVGAPTTLAAMPGFTQEHIDRALTAAKDPQLRMKLENMPVPLTPEMVDDYMGPVLEAARDGDLSRIRNV